MSFLDMGLVPAGAVPAPDAGRRIMFFDQPSGALCTKDEAGAVARVVPAVESVAVYAVEWPGTEAPAEGELCRLKVNAPSTYEGAIVIPWRGGTEMKFALAGAQSAADPETPGVSVEMGGRGYVQFVAVVGADQVAHVRLSYTTEDGITSVAMAELAFMAGDDLRLLVYRKGTAAYDWAPGIEESEIKISAAYLRRVG